MNKKNQFITVVVTILFLTTICVSAFSFSKAEAAGTDKGTFAVSGRNTALIMENNRTLVSLRTISEKMGMNVEWDQKTQTVIIKDKITVLTIHIGSKQAYKNNQPIPLEIPAKLKNGKVFVPLRFAGETFGYRVIWQNKTKTAVFIPEKINQEINNKCDKCKELLKKSIEKLNTLTSAKQDFNLTVKVEDPQNDSGNIRISGFAYSKKPSTIYTEMNIKASGIMFDKPNSRQIPSQVKFYSDGKKHFIYDGNEWKVVSASVFNAPPINAEEQKAGLLKILDTLLSWGADISQQETSNNYEVRISLDLKNAVAGIFSQIIGNLMKNEDTQKLMKDLNSDIKNGKAVFVLTIDKNSMLLDKFSGSFNLEAKNPSGETGKVEMNMEAKITEINTEMSLPKLSK